MNAPLFVRTTRRVTLTGSGASLRDHARRTFAELEAFRLAGDRAAGVVAGEVRFAAMEVFSIYLLPEALSAVVRDYPQVVPLCYEMIPQEMERRIAEGHLELGFTVGGGGAKNIDYQTLGYSRGVLVCGRKHPLYAKGRVSPAALDRYSSVVPRFFGQEHLPLIDQFPTRYGRRIGASIELLQMGVLLCLNGGYLGYFPEVSIREHLEHLRSGDLKALSGLRRGEPFELKALTRTGSTLSPAASRIFDVVRAACRKTG